MSTARAARRPTGIGPSTDLTWANRRRRLSAGRTLVFHSEFGTFGAPEEKPICRQSKSKPGLYMKYRPT